MSTITVRQLSDETVKRLKTEAKARGFSMNRWIVRVLEERTHPSPFKKKTHRDLDDLFGSMSEESFREVERTLEETRAIDEELWR